MLGGRLLLHWSWPLFPVAVGAYGLFVVPWREAVFFVALTLAVYLCVLVHEAGELLGARRFGLGARDITLYPFWSAIRYTRLSERPWQENCVAAAGIVRSARLPRLSPGPGPARSGSPPCRGDAAALPEGEVV